MPCQLTQKDDTSSDISSSYEAIVSKASLCYSLYISELEIEVDHNTNSLLIFSTSHSNGWTAWDIGICSPGGVSLKLDDRFPTQVIEV